MNESYGPHEQRLLRLISQPGLFKKAILIYVLLIVAMTIFGIVAGSIITTVFFPNSHL
jgi:hypothetical protein